MMRPVSPGREGAGAAPAAADAALVSRLSWGDEAALAELYDRYSRYVYGVALRACSSPQRAEEIVQDTFVKLWRNPAAYDASRASLATYLLTLSRNAAIDALRRERPTRPLEDEDGAPLPLAADGPDPADAAELAQLASRVRAAMSGLSDAHRRVVELAYFQGATREEIAAQTGVPVGTVKSRLKYALDRLRAHLGAGREGAP
jgi:RNA polymerase sigma-70 factor (ECF subfamily)